MMNPAASVLWFDLELMNSYSNWKGKLIVQWPGLERSWWRWADGRDPILPRHVQQVTGRDSRRRRVGVTAMPPERVSGFSR